LKVSTVRQDLTSDGSEFQMCGAATEKDRGANSVRVFGTISSGAKDFIHCGQSLKIKKCDCVTLYATTSSATGLSIFELIAPESVAPAASVDCFQTPI